MRKIDVLICCVLVGLSLFLLKDLYKPGFFTSHDGANQIVRLYHFKQALDDGQFPPRWGGELMHGYGYPLFIFSYHFPFWIAQIPLHFQADIFTSLKFVFVISYVFSAIAMYFFLRDIFGRSAAFVASFIYLMTPFRFVDIFVRAALGEAVSFAFIPLIFWSMHLLRKKYKFFSLFIGIAGVAGIFLSHVMIFSLLFIPLLLVFLLHLYYAKERIKYLILVIVMFLGGVGISAYYVVPAIYYRPQTIFLSKFSNVFTYHFTPLTKLLYSPWGYNGTDLPDEMSRQVGLTLWFVLLLGIVTIVWLVYKGKKKKNMQWQMVNTGIVYTIGFLFAIFMMVKESTFLWKYIQSIVVVEFPWRNLVVTTFLGSCLSAFLIGQFKNKYLKIGLILLLLIITTYTNRNYLRINKVDDISVAQRVDSEPTTSLLNEYLPVWVDVTNIKNRKFFVESDLSIKQITKNSNSIDFEFATGEEKTIVVHHMYFPGWKAYLNGREVEIKKTPAGSMLMDLQSDESGKIHMKFEETNVMRLGNFISLATVAWLLGLFGIRYLRKNPSQN